MIKALLNLFIIIVRIGIKKFRKVIKTKKEAKDYLIGYVSHADKFGYKYMLDYHALNRLGIDNIDDLKDKP